MASQPALESALAELAQVLSREVPISQHLGIQVGGDARHLRLSAPLAANRNHQGTAFAGSVNAVATLAGWSAVWLLLRSANIAAQVVIQDSRIDYLHPIADDFAAACPVPEAASAGALLEALRRHGRGRLALDVLVTSGAHSGATVLARFSGRYVALTHHPVDPT